jgi:hypothetical protein
MDSNSTATRKRNTHLIHERERSFSDIKQENSDGVREKK